MEGRKQREWQRPKHPTRWRNRIPQAIVDAFEAEGFIWGGRWFHYDTMHFEYRPELLDPANRFQSHHPSGFTGASFEVAGLLVWGFTAGLLDRLLRLAGWERPWDTSRVQDLPAEVLERIDREMGRR